MANKERTTATVNAMNPPTHPSTPPKKGRAKLASVETHRVVSSAPWSFSAALVVTLFFQEQLIRFSCPRSELVKDAPLWSGLTGSHETPNLLRIWRWATFYRMMSKASFFSQRHTASAGGHGHHSLMVSGELNVHLSLVIPPFLQQRFEKIGPHQVHLEFVTCSCPWAPY